MFVNRTLFISYSVFTCSDKKGSVRMDGYFFSVNPRRRILVSAVEGPKMAFKKEE